MDMISGWIYDLFIISVFFVFMSIIVPLDSKANLYKWMIDLRKSLIKINSLTTFTLESLNYFSGNRFFSLKIMFFILVLTSFIPISFIFILLYFFSDEFSIDVNLIYYMPVVFGTFVGISIYSLPNNWLSLIVTKFFLKVKKIYFYIFLLPVNVAVVMFISSYFNYVYDYLIYPIIKDYEFESESNEEHELRESFKEKLLEDDFFKNLSSEYGTDDFIYLMGASFLNFILIPSMCFSLLISLSALFLLILSIVFNIGYLFFVKIPEKISGFNCESNPFLFLGLITTSLYSLIYWLV